MVFFSSSRLHLRWSALICPPDAAAAAAPKPLAAAPNLSAVVPKIF
jgi:hypothetical protein